MHQEFLWVHSDIDHPHGELDTNHRLPFSAATLSVNPSGTQWMFLQEVISCLCCGPGRWTTADAAVCLFLHPSLHYTHNLALASHMISCECRGMLSFNTFMLTTSLDYNCRKTNSSGLLLSTFIPLKRPSTWAVSLQNKLKNCAANLLAVETSWTAWNWITNTSQDNLLSFLTFHPPQLSWRLSGLYIGEHGQLWQLKTINSSQNGFFFFFFTCQMYLTDHGLKQRIHQPPTPVRIHHKAIWNAWLPERLKCDSVISS